MNVSHIPFLRLSHCYSVGAVGKDATHASYSNTGSAL